MQKGINWWPKVMSFAWELFPFFFTRVPFTLQPHFYLRRGSSPQVTKGHVSYIHLACDQYFKLETLNLIGLLKLQNMTLIPMTNLLPLFQDATQM